MDRAPEIVTEVILYLLFDFLEDHQIPNFQDEDRVEE